MDSTARIKYSYRSQNVLFEFLNAYVIYILEKIYFMFFRVFLFTYNTFYMDLVMNPIFG